MPEKERDKMTMTKEEIKNLNRMQVEQVISRKNSKISFQMRYGITIPENGITVAILLQKQKKNY